MKAVKKIALLFLFTFLIFGCDQITNPLSPDGETSVENLSGHPMPSLAKENDADFGGVLATINFELEISEGLPSAAISMGFANFGKHKDAGSVSVNNNELSKNEREGVVFYMSPSQTSVTGLSNVKFDGSEHKWNVSGSDSVKPFTASVVSPSSFTLTAPENNATVSKADGIEVTWEGSSSDSKILIIVASDNSEVKPFVKQDIPDNGSYKISSLQLGDLSGKVYLQVAKYNYTTKENDGKTYVVLSEIVKVKTLTLN